MATVADCARLDENPTHSLTRVCACVKVISMGALQNSTA